MLFVFVVCWFYVICLVKGNWKYDLKDDFVFFYFLGGDDYVFGKWILKCLRLMEDVWIMLVVLINLIKL